MGKNLGGVGCFFGGGGGGGVEVFFYALCINFHSFISLSLSLSLSLQIQHRHFTAWYDVVLSRRLAFGKARALADWRLTLRVWNAWRSYVRSQRITIETKQHEQNVVEESRYAD